MTVWLKGQYSPISVHQQLATPRSEASSIAFSIRLSGRASPLLEQGDPTPDQRDTAATLRKLDGKLRGQQIMFESFVTAMMRERQNSKVPDWTMEIAMQKLTRETSDDDPYMRGHVYEAVTDSINSLRLALQR